ncbi:unnamed protein product [Meloidogyne enterolobii]|uniref:Uncharacterized protein n=1 Tax=Meloidogyne enterolobii TaxID=390850 RepID=A0ACB0Y4P3_MELEN
MLLTERGGNRQEAHARIREITLDVGKNSNVALIVDQLQEVISSSPQKMKKKNAPQPKKAFKQTKISPSVLWLCSVFVHSRAL